MLLSKHTKKIITAFSYIFILFITPNIYGKENTTSNYIKDCKHRAFSITISNDVSIKEALDQLADMCKFSVIAKDIQAKKVLDTKINTINIRNMALFEVFDLLLKEQNINYKFKNNLLQIYSVETRIFKIDYITSIREGTAVVNASVDIEPLEIGERKDIKKTSDNEIRTTEKFDFWKTLDAELKSILNNGSEEYVASEPIININAGLITVTGTKSQLDRVSNYLNALKARLHKQVLIDVSIIAVELGNDYSTGINWKKFQLGINTKHDSQTNTFQSTGSAEATFFNTLNNSAKNLNIISNINFSMEGLMNFIAQRGESKVISSPKVMTLNNQQALITIGDNINYRVLEETDHGDDGKKTKITYKMYSVFIGVLLNILPEVSDDNQIMLRINPSLSSFKYREDDQKQVGIREIAPDTLEKKLSTVVRVNSGDTIILGGLIGQTKSKDNVSVPVLSSLPILGNAFKSTEDRISTTELVFVITPHIIDNNTEKSLKTSLKALGYSESLYE